MKRILCVIAMTVVSLMVFAQNQQGYVKTKGRLGNNGTVIAGSRLSGATVQVKGSNAVVSGSNGAFTLAIPGNNYYLQSVQKQGYVVTDPDVLSRQYAYSKNPLVLVLETPSQQTDDRLAAMKKIGSTLRRQLQEKEDEIETLKEQQKLSEEEYRQQLQELYDQHKSDVDLISDMAERYSRMDFDEVDEFNWRISSLILEGKLTEADSLLNTKGDINSRAEALRQHQEANAQAEQELQKKKKKLEKSKILAQKELEDLAQDCYRKFEIFNMQHQNDSAEYYIELRASLNPDNLEWRYDLARFYEKYIADYKRALSIYEQCMELCLSHYGRNSQEATQLYISIGSVLREMAEYDKSLKNLNVAMELEKENGRPESEDVVRAMMHIGLVYSDQEKDDEAIACYKRVLESGACSLKDSIRAYINVAAVYIHEDKFQESLNYYETALDLLQRFSDTEYDYYISGCYNGLSNIYRETDDFGQAIEYNKKALETNRRMFGDEHPQVSIELNNMGSLYNKLGKYKEAIEYLEQAAACDSVIYGTWHPMLASDYNNIGPAYSDLGQYEKALYYYEKALRINLNFYGHMSSHTATNISNIGYVYVNMKQYDKALEYFNEALEISLSIFGEHHGIVSTCYNNIGDIYIETGQYDKAETILQKALETNIAVYGEQHTQVATVYNNFGRLYNESGDYAKSAYYMEKALPILSKAYGEEHPYLAISYYNISVLHKKNNDYETALQLAEKAYRMMSKFLPEDHATMQQFKNGIEDIKEKMKD